MLPFHQQFNLNFEGHGSGENSAPSSYMSHDFVTPGIFCGNQLYRIRIPVNSNPIIENKQTTPIDNPNLDRINQVYASSADDSSRNVIESSTEQVGFGAGIQSSPEEKLDQLKRKFNNPFINVDSSTLESFTKSKRSRLSPTPIVTSLTAAGDIAKSVENTKTLEGGGHNNSHKVSKRKQKRSLKKYSFNLV